MQDKRRSNSRHPLISVFAVLALLMGACGGSDEQSVEATPTTVPTTTTTAARGPFSLPSALAVSEATGHEFEEVIVLGSSPEEDEALQPLSVQCDGPKFQPIDNDEVWYSAPGVMLSYTTYQFADSTAAEAALAAGAEAEECGDPLDPPIFYAPEPLAVPDGIAIESYRYYGDPNFGLGEMAWVVRDDTVLVVHVQGLKDQIADYVALAFP